MLTESTAGANLERQLRAMDYDFLIGGEARVRRGQKAYDDLCRSIAELASVNAIEAELLCRTHVPPAHLENYERFFAAAAFDAGLTPEKASHLAATPARIRSSAHRLVFGETQQFGSIAIKIYEQAKDDLGKGEAWSSRSRTARNVEEFNEFVRAVEDAAVMVVYLNGQTYADWDRRTVSRSARAVLETLERDARLTPPISSVVDARHRFKRDNLIDRRSDIATKPESRGVSWP